MIFDETFGYFGKKRKEDPVKLERDTEQNAIRDGNNLLELMPGLDSTIFRLVQELGNGDPMKAYEELYKTAGNEANRTAAIFLRDTLSGLKNRLRISWKIPTQTYNATTMNSLQIIKYDDLCEATNPPIWSLYRSPVTGEPKEIQIRKMIVRPLNQK